MIRWKPFVRGDIVYSLDHLHPRQLEYEQPAEDNRPARKYRVQLIFGLHCFTRSPAPGETVDVTLQYSDSRETRLFCPRRYQMSFLLPTIMEGLQQRRCFHTGKGNFFVVEIVDESGARQEYEVYFLATRAARRGELNLFVQSSYIRDDRHARNRPNKKPIRLYAILFGALNGRMPREPPR